MTDNKPIKYGAIISYVGILLNIAISFLYTPWMIRKIGVSDYGLYSLILSFISYFILDFGLSQAIQRFIAKYRAENNEDKVAKMVGITTKVYLAIDAFIFIVLFVFYFFISNIFTGLTPAEVERVKGLYIIAGTFSVLTFMFKPLAGAMMAFEFFMEEKALELLNKVGTVLFVCLALSFGADVYALVFINGAIALFASFAKYLVFKHKSKLKIQWSYFNKGELKSVFSFSAWTFVISLAQRMRITIVPTILGILSNSTEISLFALGITIEGILFSFSHALNGLFLPKVTRMIHQESRSEVNSLMIKVGRIQLFIISLLFYGFVASGFVFLNLWVGAQFSSVYYIVLCFIVPNTVLFTQSIANDVVYVDNVIKSTATMTLASSAIGLVLACSLAHSMGAVGCAIGTGSGMALNAVWLNIFYKKVLKIDVMRFFKNCHMKIMPLIIAYAIVGYLVCRNLVIDSWLMLFVVIGVYTMGYLAIVWLFLANDYEKGLILGLVTKKKISNE